MSILDAIDRRLSEILAVAARCGAPSVRIFGSVARGEESESCDVEFLVVPEPGRSLLDHSALKLGLEELLGQPVDVAAERGVKPKFRVRILEEAVAL